MRGWKECLEGGREGGGGGRQWQRQAEAGSWSTCPTKPTVQGRHRKGKSIKVAAAREGRWVGELRRPTEGGENEWGRKGEGREYGRERRRTR